MSETGPYYVYILASRSRRLYVGMTNNLERRVWEHRTKAAGGFTSRYEIHRLVWYSGTSGVLEAIAYEKRLKGWSRQKKLFLIEAQNAEWRDLADEWFSENSADTEIPRAGSSQWGLKTRRSG